MKEKILKLLAWQLKQLARLTLSKYQPSVVGITGNVGKTSTKIAIETVLGSERRVRSSPKNFNNELGLPLSVLGDWDSTEGGIRFWTKVIFTSVKNCIVRRNDFPEVIILEYGVDRPHDMHYLLSIVRPQIGVVTAVGEVPVHVEFFTDPEGVAKEKAKLVQQLPATGFSILNRDDAYTYAMKDGTRSHVITFGFSEKAEMRIINFSNFLEEETGHSGISFKLDYAGNIVPVKIGGVLGRTAAYASAAAAAVGLTFGMNLVKIADALSNYREPPGRLRVIPGIKGTVLIDDTYNAAVMSTLEALDTLASLHPKRAIAVLGDILEIGKYTMSAHEDVGRRAAKCADIVVTIGMRAKFIAEGAKKAGMPKQKIFSFDSLHEAGLFLEEHVRKGDVILIKGSQAVRMEKIVKTLMQSPHAAKDVLVRQSRVWLAKPGMYE